MTEWNLSGQSKRKGAGGQCGPEALAAGLRHGGSKFTSDPALHSESSMQLLQPKPNSRVQLALPGWRAVLAATPTPVDSTSYYFWGLRMTDASPPQPSPLKKGVGLWTLQNVCPPHPGVSQLVLGPWLDQKWQLCHHSRTAKETAWKGLCEIQRRRELSGFALSIIVLYPRRLLLESGSSSPLGLELGPRFVVLMVVGSCLRAEDQNPPIARPWR